MSSSRGRSKPWRRYQRADSSWEERTRAGVVCVYDAVLVPTGVGKALATQTLAQRFVHEAWRHGKPIAVATDGKELLEAAGVPVDDDGVTVADAAQLARQLMRDLGQHRFPRRVSVLKPS